MSSSQASAKILGFIPEDASSWVIGISVFAAGLLLTALLAISNVGAYQCQLSQRFELLANERITRVQERLDSQVRRLDSLRRFYVYSDDVSEAEFNGFALPMLIQTQAYSWAPVVAEDQRVAFEQQAQASGKAGYQVRELNEQQVLIATHPRPVYFPVRYTQTRSNIATPMGFDLNSESRRHATIERALQTGTLAASPRMELVGMEEEDRKGVLLISPVLSLPNGLEGPPALQGLLTAAISLRKIMTEGLPAADEDNLALTLVDITAAQLPDELYHAASEAVEFPAPVVSTLGFAGRTYLARIQPTAAFIYANPAPDASVALLGVSLSVILSALSFTLLGQRRRALKLVHQRTLQLRQGKQQLRGMHNQLRNVLDAATQLAIIATDLNGLITTFNIGASKMLGYDSAQVCGSLMLRDLHLPAELDEQALELTRRYGRAVSAHQAMLAQALEEPGHQARDWTFVRQDGSRLRVSMQVSHVLDESDQWIGYLVVCLDITERKRVEDELRTMSVTDALTGIYNRRYFQQRLQDELQRVQRHAGTFSVVMLDIDHFKLINDRFGHAVGDHVLRAICERLCHRLRRSDVFCRLGGEEFMVLCPDTSGDHALGLANQLWDALRGEPVDGVGQVTASFGVASWRDGEGGDALLLRADAGVYAAKMRGRDRVERELA